MTKLKERLKEVRGKFQGKGKGKALPSKEVVALVTKAVKNCIHGTMNDKTVDLLQVCLQGTISASHFMLLYTCRFTMGMPSGPHQ